jgi:alpha-glucosidase
MTDPAVAYAPNSGYGAYDRGKEVDVWLKAENGSDFLGVVWPGKSTKIVFINIT